ncbi:Peroxisomal membrane protein like [Quillaja saponaria]|uniref:Peroxisomal membrane protein like n=1 Tax=Quillaja saponaria TaxID=32244 RepID=A0AAD7PPI1_QUISA|nr:Peroxisomal membrane protein like [Quillaja saponaria]
MSTLDATRAELALLVLYLNKAEARDKICRAIQYGSKFLSNGEPGTAQNVDKSTSLARKVFRLFKFVNDLHGLISPTPQGTPLPLVLLGKSKNALLSTFLFLDQIVWLGRTGIYKNKERTELIGRISLFCWLGSSICTSLVELGELGRLSASTKKLEKELKNSNKYENEQYRAKLKQSNERTLALIKSGMDIVVAVGLLQLAPKKVTPRVTGAFGFVSSLISCYQVLPLPLLYFFLGFVSLGILGSVRTYFLHLRSPKHCEDRSLFSSMVLQCGYNSYLKFVK